MPDEHDETRSDENNVVAKLPMPEEEQERGLVVRTKLQSQKIRERKDGVYHLVRQLQIARVLVCR
jgi:DNA topoisomerase VI subunit B